MDGSKRNHHYKQGEFLSERYTVSICTQVSEKYQVTEKSIINFLLQPDQTPVTSGQEQLVTDIYKDQFQWAKAKGGNNPGTYSQSILEARELWRQLDRTGVARQEITTFQLLKGMLTGEGHHWSQLQWKQQYYLRS